MEWDVERCDGLDGWIVGIGSGSPRNGLDHIG